MAEIRYQRVLLKVFPAQDPRHVEPVIAVVTVIFAPTLSVTLFGRVVLGPNRALVAQRATLVPATTDAGVTTIETGLNRPEAA